MSTDRADGLARSHHGRLDAQPRRGAGAVEAIRAVPLVRAEPRDAERPGVERGAGERVIHDRHVERLLACLSRKVGRDGYDRYFRDQTRVHYAPGRLEITVPTGFVAQVIGERFARPILEAARETLTPEDGAGDRELRLNVRVDGSAFATLAGEAGQAPAAGHMQGAASEAHAGPGRTSPSTNGHAPALAAPARAAEAARTRATGSTRRAIALRGRLEDFVVAGSNRLAYAAAERMCEEDCPSSFSPLFIYGGCGVGKTHLLQGMARRMGERHPESSVVYLTAEAFTNEYIHAVQTKRVDTFRKSYRGVDLLCLDDVHFLTGKSSTQGELLHTFDAIDLVGARVALASDEHPKQVRDLSRGLISRFMSGMLVRLDPPDAALRERLVEVIAQRRGMRLDDAAMKLVAHHGVGPAVAGPSVRDLEGDLTRVQAVAMATPGLCAEDGTIGLNVVRQALGLGERPVPGVGPGGRVRAPIRADQIVGAVCSMFRVEPSELMGRGRHPRVVMARSAAAWLARTVTTMSFPEIARALGRPSHSTVVTACQRVEGQMRSEEALDLGPAGAIPELAGLTVRQALEQLRHDLLGGR